MSRISKDLYYLNIARGILERSTCLRRKFGAVIVKEDQIISTGYGGSPRKTKNCSEIKICARKELNAKKGEHYEWCRAVHAEQNAIIQAARLDMLEATLYLIGLNSTDNSVITDAEPCKICKRLIINAGLKNVIIYQGENKIPEMIVKDWVDSHIGEIIEKDGQWIPILKDGYK